MTAEPDREVAELLGAFSAASREHFEATLAGDHKAANRAADRVHRAFLKLRDRGEEAREALLEVAERGEDAASLMAAVYSLKYDPDRSLRILARFSTHPGVAGFQARQAVKRWKSGEWQLE